MTLSIKHAFNNAKADGADTTVVRPSDWNADHTLAGVASAAQGGTGIAYVTLAGPTSGHTYTLPDADATILTSNAAVTVAQGGTGLASGTSGGVLYYSAAGTLASSAALAANGVVVGGGAGNAPATSANLTFGGAAAGTGLAIAAGTAASAVSAQTITQTRNFNTSATDYVQWKFTTTSTNASDRVFNILAGSSGAETTVFSINTSGNIAGLGGGTTVGIKGSGGFATFLLSTLPRFSVSPSKAVVSQGMGIGWSDDSNSSETNFDTQMSRGGLNQIIFTTGNTVGGGTATSRAEINKAVTGVADATPTATFTVTVPNAAHSASIRLRLTGSLGAGGAIGANESTQDAEYHINVTRTAGVNAVATIGSVTTQAAAASVAGANNAAVVGTLSAIAGAVGATNTFTINVTITKSAGASASHTCLAFAELLNANASGVTIA